MKKAIMGRVFIGPLIIMATGPIPSCTHDTRKISGENSRRGQAEYR